MPIDIRCTCGTRWRVENDVATSLLKCADCGQALPWPSAAENVPVVNLAPFSPAQPLETVPITPFYQPDAPVKVELFGYGAVETARLEPEPKRSDRPPISRSAGPSDPEPYEPYYTHADFEELELRRLVAVRRGQWRYQSRRRPLDRNGWDCFLFAGQAWWIILMLGFGWLVLTPIILLGLPTPQSLGPEMWVPRAFAVAVFFGCLGATWTFLRDVYGMGSAGVRDLKLRLLCSLRALAESALTALVALMAGPSVLVAAAVWFWIGAGEMTWVDWLVIGQLGFCAGVLWVYLLLAIEARGGDGYVAAIIGLVRQGRPGWIFPLVGGASLTVFGFLLVQILAMMLEMPLPALALQLLLWLASLYLWAGMMRWFGIISYRRTHADAPIPSAHAAG